MRVVIQRVSHASCTVDGNITGKIEKGFLIFVGFKSTDTTEKFYKTLNAKSPNNKKILMKKIKIIN